MTEEVRLMSQTPICFVDTETDGIHPTRKPWEIAMIRRHGEFQVEMSFFVDIDLSTADPFGLRIGGFYERHPLGRSLSGLDDFDPVASWADPDFKSQMEAAHMVARMTHGAHLIGAVPNFDTEVLDRLLRAAGILPDWHYHLIDVETLAVGYLRSNGVDDQVLPLPWKSDDIMAALGVEPPADKDRHTALGDARWAMRTYDKVMSG
jgi:hypothetical protein